MNLHPILKIDKSFMQCYLKKNVILLYKRAGEVWREVYYAFIDDFIDRNGGNCRLPSSPGSSGKCAGFNGC